VDGRIARCASCATVPVWHNGSGWGRRVKREAFGPDRAKRRGDYTRRGSMRQGACLSWMLFVYWYPADQPQTGTFEVYCVVPARVFGSHV
jgi:hypothetical protein